MQKKHYLTGFLFSDPSLISGAATVINIAGNFYDFNSSENGEEADENAILHDFRMVGQDFENAIETFSN